MRHATRRPSTNQHTRASSIIQAFSEICDPRTVEPLIQHLLASHNDEQAYTIYALTCLGDKRAVPALLALQHDMTPVDIGNPYTLRAVVMHALAAIADPETFDVLLDAINDPDVEVRWSAVNGLGRIGDPRALPALTRALDDFDETQWGAIISEDASEAIAAIQARQHNPEDADGTYS